MAAVLTCELQYAGEPVQLMVSPSGDPYSARTLDIAGRFRFRALAVGAEGQLEYVKLYVYDLSLSGSPVLLHQATHTAPLAIVAVPGLTGWHRVYSSVLGREFIYGCGIVEP